jgi:hypothetical protein
MRLPLKPPMRSWEIIQFRDATLIGERTYRLTTLLRGQVGTERSTELGILPGARVALLDGRLKVSKLTESLLNETRTFRIGPVSEGIGGLNVTTFDIVPRARGRMPLSPVHGRARLRPSDGALELSWIRRTRIGGDDWVDSGDVPLGETEERYQLDILSEGSPVRSVEVETPQYVYSLADQTVDFGGAIDKVSMRVAQVSPGFGPGVPYEVTVNVQQP